MISAYYLWKWADNDLPGKPDQVFASLVRGRFPAALQPFPVAPLLPRLRQLARARRAAGEAWYWQVQPADKPGLARFVFLIGPHLNDSASRVGAFADALEGLGLSGYDEHYGHVIHVLAPKRNCLLLGQDYRLRYYDLTADELPALLSKLDPHARDPFIVLRDAAGGFVECRSHRHGFRVEWQQVNSHGAATPTGHWRAYRSPRYADPGTLSFGDVCRVFQAFVQHQERPARYRWRRLTRRMSASTGRKQRSRS